MFRTKALWLFRRLIWTRRHTRRALIVKGFVTATFVAYVIDHTYALPVMLVGNLVWVWVDADGDGVPDIMQDEGGSND